MIEIPSVKFEVEPTSRNQVEKFQVSPGAMLITPTTGQFAVRSTTRSNEPEAPEFLICPGPLKRPMLPPTQRIPDETGMAAWVAEVTNSPNWLVGRPLAWSVRSLSAMAREPTASMWPGTPEEFVAAGEQ